MGILPSVLTDGHSVPTLPTSVALKNLFDLTALAVQYLKGTKVRFSQQLLSVGYNQRQFI